MAIQTCPHCNSPINPGARFCRSCGKPIVAASGVMAGTPAPLAPSPALPVQAPHPEVLRPGRSSRSILKRPLTWILLLLVVLVGMVCLAAAGIGVAYYLGYIDLSSRTGPVPTPIIAVAENTATVPSGTDTPLPSPATLTPAASPVPTLTSIIVPGLDIELPHLTDAEEIEIGQETAREFEREFELSHDAAYIEQVNRIGASILPFQPRQNIPFTFQVIESDDLNAFALPGGFIYVTSGLIEYVESEDELAGVIGHEIAHVALRHGAQQIEYLAGAQVVIDVLSTSEPDFASIYQEESAQLAIQMAGMILLNGWGRGAELDADEYGAIYMHAAGYDVHAILALFTRFQAYEDSSAGDLLNRLLSTHPPFADRIARVEEAILTHSLDD